MNKLKKLSLAILVVLPFLISGQCLTNYAISSGLSGVNNTAVWTDIAQVVGAPDDNGVKIFNLVAMTPGRSTSIAGVWNFDLDVPCNATIDNVSFTFTRRNAAASGTLVDEDVLLKFGDFTYSPTNGGVSSPWLNSTTSWETYTYAPAGGWGVTLTPEMVNDPLFGLIFTAENRSTTEDAWPEIDAVEVQVCYTLNGPALPRIIATVETTSDNLCDPIGNASIVVNATGGTGTYEYSIDNGATWQNSNTFPGLSSDTYFVAVRNDDQSCQIDLGAAYIGCVDGRILQVGDAVYTCKPTIGDNITLAIDRIQPLYSYYANGDFYRDISSELETKAFSWTTTDLGGPVFGVAYDESGNIYTGVSSLYEIISPVPSADLISIDAATGAPSVIATLPGTAGIAQLEYQQDCGQLFVSNLEDGMIYRYSTAGALLSTFDPLTADDGTVGLAPLGERVVGLSYNPVDGRLYYSVWANDKIQNGNFNTVRSVQIDPTTCDFLPLTDFEEIVIPHQAYIDGTYSSPVLDIEFNEVGNIMLLAESGFDSTVPQTEPHRARLLRYDGATTAWVSVNNLPAGNTNYQYELGDINGGSNSLGGVDFGYAGIGTSGCVDDQGSFIVATGDALKGVDCTTNGCVYGIQYLPLEGGNPQNSVLVDLARAPDSQQKGFFGDIDVVNGCCPCACPDITFTVTASDNDICNGEDVTLCIPSVTGGTAPYTYEWSTAETTNCVDVMPATTTNYAVTVTDNNNCTDDDDIDVTVSSAIIVSNVSGSNDTDCTTDNGSITITASGGSGALTYSVDNGATYVSSNVISDLGAGTYDVVIQDAFNCTMAGGAVMISGPTTLTLASVDEVDDTDCEIDNGSITINALGGDGNFTYSIDGGTTFTASNSFTGLRAGNYNIVIQDGGNCSLSNTATIGGPALFTVDISKVDVTDCLIANGSITATPIGGATPFTYSVDGGATFGNSNVFNALATGLYSVIVRDGNNCAVASNVEILAPVCGGSIGNSVWVDVDGDGIQDNGEPGLSDIRVELVNDLGEVVSVTTSDNSGDFVFDDIIPGDYFLRYKNLEEYVPTLPNAGGNTNLDSDVDNSNGENTTPFFSLSAGELDLSRDFGVYICVPIGELVWLDRDEDGVADIGENGINGLRVELYQRVANFWLKKDFTYTGHKPGTGSDDGYYKFCTAPGEYYLKFNNPPDRLVRAQPNRGNDRTDSDVTDRFGPGTTDAFTVQSGDEKCDLGAGFVAAGSIGDFVWVDADRDGRRSINEQGLEGVDVKAISVTGEMISSTITDSDGRYMLDLLPQDEYFVEFTLPEDYTMTIPHKGSDETLDSDVDDSNGKNTTGVYFVSPGNHIESVDAGVVSMGLPVTWLSVSGETVRDENVITWKVAAETNVSSYEVQYRNENDLEFKMIGDRVSDYGTHQGLLSYDWNHKDFAFGINYYRVKQFDFDGRYEYSDVVAINNYASIKDHDIKIFPNPVVAELNIGLNLFQDSKEVSVRLYDNVGRLVSDNLILDVNLNKGYKLYTVDVAHITQGVYSLEIIVDNTMVIKKIAITD